MISSYIKILVNLQEVFFFFLIGSPAFVKHRNINMTYNVFLSFLLLKWLRLEDGLITELFHLFSFQAKNVSSPVPHALFLYSSRFVRNILIGTEERQLRLTRCKIHKAGGSP